MMTPNCSVQCASVLTRWSLVMDATIEHYPACALVLQWLNLQLLADGFGELIVLDEFQTSGSTIFTVPGELSQSRDSLIDLAMSEGNGGLRRSWYWVSTSFNVLFPMVKKRIPNKVDLRLLSHRPNRFLINWQGYHAIVFAFGNFQTLC